MGSLLLYIAFGSIAFALQLLLLALFVEGWRANPTLSSGFAFAAATMFNYLCQYHWNFRAEGDHTSTFSRYCLVMVVTLLLNSVLFWILTQFFGFWYLYSQFCVTGVVVIANFFLHRHYTFI